MSLDAIMSNTRISKKMNSCCVIAPNCDIKDPRLTKMRGLTGILIYQTCLLAVLTTACYIFNDPSQKFTFFMVFVVLQSVVTFLLFGLDKGNAEYQRWRVPERTLHLFCLFFGFIGAIAAMQMFR